MNEQAGVGAPTATDRSRRVQLRWWLFAVVCLGASLPPMNEVGATEEPGGAKASDDDAAAFADSADIARTVAPEWPFLGIVAAQYERAPDESTVLLYWDSETGALSEVSLDQRSWGTYCPTEFSANRHRVLYSLYSHGGHLEFVAPWGDDAYPILHSERFVDYYTSADNLPEKDGDAGQPEVAMQNGILRVDISQDVAYYRFTHGSADGETGLERIDSRSGEAKFEAEPDEDERIWGARARGRGAAGFYYGFEVRASEPACQAEKAYIVDGRTGELVRCSPSFGGPSPIFVGPSALQTLALPRRFSSTSCDGLDLGNLDPSGVLVGGAG